MKYFETTYTFSVLSEGKLEPGLTLMDLDRMMLDGLVAQFYPPQVRELTAKEAAKRLREMGSVGLGRKGGKRRKRYRQNVQEEE